MSIKNTSSILTITISGLLLSSCAAISTEMHHSKLTTASKMSSSIFLDPVSDNKKVIYVQVHDTSGQNVKLKSKVSTLLTDKGWTVTHNIKKANDMLQINVLQAGKAPNIASVWQSMSNGYGSAMLGGFTGLAAGLATGDAGTGVGVGLATGAVSWVANEMVKDVTYSMVTDIQVSVRVSGVVSHHTKANITQGSSTTTNESYNTKSHWLHYRARVASVADKVNLKFKDAKPALEQQVASEIAGIFDN